MTKKPEPVDPVLQAIYDELVARHHCESVTDRAIAKSLATALTEVTIDPALVERLTALLPAKAVAAPSSLTVEFVDPRLSHLSDTELTALEALMAKLEGVPVEPNAPESEEVAAIRRRDEEIGRLWKDQRVYEERISGLVREVDRLQRELAASCNK